MDDKTDWTCETNPQKYKGVGCVSIPLTYFDLLHTNPQEVGTKRVGPSKLLFSLFNIYIFILKTFMNFQTILGPTRPIVSVITYN